MKVVVQYVGSSLLAPLRQAEREINRQYDLGLRIKAYNCGGLLAESEWTAMALDLAEADLVFIIHVTDGESAARIGALLEQHQNRHQAVIAINCLGELMRRTRLGKLSFHSTRNTQTADAPLESSGKQASGLNLVRKLGSWMADYVKARQQKTSGPSKAAQHNLSSYRKLIDRLPAILRFLPESGKVGDFKHYLFLYCYFLQPTPNNIRSMVLYALKHYLPGLAERLEVAAPEVMPAVGIYHPDAPQLFPTFEAYQQWHDRRAGESKPRLVPENTIGLLLMRPQIVSRTTRHYDGLIRALEATGLAVVPAISTLMDNREAVTELFVERKGKAAKARFRQGQSAPPAVQTRVSQIVSLTGFSFVGGPAMNDSEAAVEFLRELNIPLHSLVSLDLQNVEHWRESPLGLNPIQTAMQVAIPELDGATEPIIFGGMPADEDQPAAIEERCRLIARRLQRWQRLRAAPREQLRLALTVFCFPPDKGNIGTAAELDVFPSLWHILRQLQTDGYQVEVPPTPEALRDLIIGGNSEDFGTAANVAYRMSVDEYRRCCPYVDEIEQEWGRAPGQLNSNGREVLILGAQLGQVFIGVQPTFGYEGDPMRLLMAQGGAPHHGFMGFYTYLNKIFGADAVIHVGTHGALEFMPGKQVGLSADCWPDRLIGELPNIYLYSVNNPSEGTIARRRSYAELISYLTPPIENAGLYKDLAELKELLTAYRQSGDEAQQAQLFGAIEELAAQLKLAEPSQAKKAQHTSAGQA